MSDEILLSESNLERVWMDAGWNTRIEWTEAGQEFQDARNAAREAVRARPRRRAAPWAWVVGVAVGAAAAAGLSRVL